MVASMMDAPDPQKLIGDVLRLGTVETVDLAQATCTVRVGDMVTGDIPFIASRAGAFRIWCPPSIGEQVLLICPEGDMLAALALGGIFSDAHPAPASTAILHIECNDGAIFSYDPATHALKVTLPAGGTAQLDAPGGLTITGPVTIKGPVRVEDDLRATGTITGDTDVKGGGKSLKDHKHTAVQAGGAISGPPQ